MDTLHYLEEKVYKLDREVHKFLLFQLEMKEN